MFVAQIIDQFSYNQDTPTTRAIVLDRLADAELQHGHHLAAEQLARRAAELREVAQ